MTASSPSSSAVLVATGAAAGTLLTLAILQFIRRPPSLAHAEDCRRRLPKTIILLRHGESEANADMTIWKKIPDNLVGLTKKGREQALAIGERVEKVLQKNKCHRVHMVVSPFERTLQTASFVRQAFESRIGE
jgi:hypothetical protein